jgi:hypothetical protein
VSGPGAPDRGPRPASYHGQAFSRDSERLARFEREAKIVIVMELIPGEDLRERLARGAMRLERASTAE